MLDIQINMLAVLVAGVVNMIVGTIWYSPSVFGKLWMKENAIKESDAKSANMGQSYLVTFIGALVMAYALALVMRYTAASTAVEGLKIGLWLWLGFCAVIPLNDVIFGKKSNTLYGLNIFYYLVIIVINSMILATWM